MSLSDKTGHSVSSRIRAVLIGMSGSFFLFAAYLVVPPIGIFTGLVAPFPVAFIRFRYGRSIALISVLGGTAAMVGLFGIAAGVFYLLQCGLIAVLMTELLLRGFGGARSIAWTTAVNVVLVAAVVAGFVLTSGQDINKLIVTEIQGSVAQAVSMYEKGGVKGDDLSVLKQTMATAAELVIKLYPALVTLTLIAMAGCNLAALRRVADIRSRLNVGDFKVYRNPDYLVWVLIAAGFAMLADNHLITTPALNILAITTLLYFLQGMAVIVTVISRQNIAGVLRVGLYIMLILQPYLAALVAAIGIFDLWGDFRAPRKQENL